ncbi:hypothetical protein [Paenibacillus abyssi]|uniref:Uncharacterized protein n=1 Tax=Paenibacillus abyssi TaxID=1340531 RepID=A0A917G5U7_9BACL|nr:hypothetical protein [Paenibacillus abyssi]GGG24607.1 hypothetical protein GCM10010916_46390 [Paenibacillus abyssi]
MANISIRETETGEIMYLNGQLLHDDRHFEDHIEHQVPIQIYLAGEHRDIGFIEQYCREYVKVNQATYHRSLFHFISRPGY